MAELFHLEVVTPVRTFYSGEASFVEFTTTEGQIGVYKNHIPVTAVIAPGILRIQEEEQQLKAALLSGLVRISADNITILTETAEWPHEINYDRAVKARSRAENRLSDKDKEVDMVRAESALKRALARLDMDK